jgi:hypothetical protein
MAFFKHVVAGPQEPGDFWSTSFHSTGTLAIANAHAQFALWVAAVFGDTALVSAYPVGFKVRDLTTYTVSELDGKATGVVRSGTVIDGTGTGKDLPPRDCLVLGLRTAAPGGRGRGRMYLPALDANSLDVNGVWLPSVLTTVLGVISTGFQDLIAAGVTPAVWSSVGNVPPVQYQAIPVTGFTMSVVPGSQRRRSNKIQPQYTTAELA